MLELSAVYLENDRQSYRRTVRLRGPITGYQTPVGATTPDERALHHMTVWRMLTWLGCQLAALAQGRQLIQQQNPTSTCHRFAGAVGPHKFRSPERERLLRQSRQLLHVVAEWEASFPEKFFPRFATRAGFS